MESKLEETLTSYQVTRAIKLSAAATIYEITDISLWDHDNRWHISTTQYINITEPETII